MLMQIKTILREIQRAKDWNQSELADELGVTQPTISRWYKGQKPETEQRDRILTLARKLSLAPDTFTMDDLTVPVVGYVGAGGVVAFGEGQGPFGEARMPPGGAAPSTVAVIVRGDSMSGLLEDGWTVYYDSRSEPPTEALFGKLCVVGLQDGRVLIKKLQPGRKPGHYDLYSTNADPALDQAVIWAARVSFLAPP